MLLLFTLVQIVIGMFPLASSRSKKFHLDALRSNILSERLYLRRLAQLLGILWLRPSPTKGWSCGATFYFHALNCAAPVGATVI
jgi:hypothetical protein